MGLKKALTAEEGDDIKKSLDFLSEEMTAVKLQQKAILNLVEEVKALRIQNAEKDQSLAFLESRVADLEQHARINDVIITGLHVKPRSYAQAVTADKGEDPGAESASSMEEQVVSFLKSKGILVDGHNIEACHPLARKNEGNQSAVMLRFVNRKHKTELIKQGRKLKGTNVYINEHLTKQNADIARKARFLRKQGKILNTWTTNCKILVKLNGSPEQAKVLLIRSLEELEKY
uniref:Uncharacterized protein n=1 Tax=Nothobranchius rachovii TaxID=451742 RepID=A0A1A8RDI2_9TELE